MKYFARQIFALTAKSLQLKIRYVNFGPNLLKLLGSEAGAYKFTFLIHVMGNINISTFFSPLEPYETLPPITRQYYHIYYRTLEREFRATYFLSVFDFKLWLGILGVCFSVTVLLGLWHFFHRKSTSAYIAMLFDIFTVSSEQVESKGISSKIAKIVTLLWIFLISSVFSSFLIAQMIVIKENKPFSSIEELLSHDTYVLCTSNYRIAIGQFITSTIDQKKIKRDQCKIGYDKKTIAENNIFCIRHDTTYIFSDREFNFLMGRENKLVFYIDNYFFIANMFIIIIYYQKVDMQLFKIVF